MNSELKEQYFISSLSVREEIENKNRKNKMAEKLINREIKLNELKDEEIEEMTRYFTQDIKNIDEELLIIKEHIQKIRQQL